MTHIRLSSVSRNAITLMLESVRITVSDGGGALSGKVGSKYAAQIVGLLASQASPMALFI